MFATLPYDKKLLERMDTKRIDLMEAEKEGIRLFFDCNLEEILFPVVESDEMAASRDTFVFMEGVASFDEINRLKKYEERNVIRILSIEHRALMNERKFFGLDEPSFEESLDEEDCYVIAVLNEKETSTFIRQHIVVMGAE